MILTLLWCLLSPPPAPASNDPVADLIERYVKEDGTLRDTEARLKFHPVRPHDTLPMPANFTFRCEGTDRSVTFEAKAGQFVHWGLRQGLPAGGVTLTQILPKGTFSTSVESHIFYRACRMDDQLVSALHKLACDQRLRATNVVVNSAFRDPIANLIEGGRPASQHLTCRAIDFWLARNTRGQKIQAQYERIPAAEVQSIASQYSIIRGLGRGATFTHADTRPGERSAWKY